MEVVILFYKYRPKKVSTVFQREEKAFRYDYEKFKVDYDSALIGGENIKDSR